MKQIILAVYTADRNTLIGYKTDSFWNLTLKKEYAKEHPLKDGKIEQHLIDNLADLIQPQDSINLENLNFFAKALISLPSKMNKVLEEHSELCLAYIELQNDNIMFTHKISKKGVFPISD